MAISSTTFRRRQAVLDVPLPLDGAAGNQARTVHDGLRSAILDGRLAAGLRLPSSRSLADQLGISRNLVVAAYEQLAGDGLIDSRRGAGTYVASQLPAPRADAEASTFEADPPPRRPFAVGRTRSDPVLLRRLAAITRRRIAMATEADLAYGDPRGSRALREQVALHLAASRGVRRDPSCILIVSGTQSGLRLCADALLPPAASVWMEDPGYPVSRRTLAAMGLRIVPVPVDADGLDVAAGRRRHAAASAAYVTPSHQFPTGVTMSMQRRVMLLDWARARNAWIFEDDYDSEFRYDGPPLTALAGIDGSDRVIYGGTFSKTLFPGLRIAYLALPPAAVAPIVTARATYDRCPPVLLEGALAELMAEGALAKHTRRMRNHYRVAREAVAEALAKAAGDALRLVVPQQGLHLVAYLPPGLPRGAADRIRRAARIEAWLLSETRVSQRGLDGFVLGFSGHDIPALVAASVRLGRAARNHLRTSP